MLFSRAVVEQPWELMVTFWDAAMVTFWEAVAMVTFWEAGFYGYFLGCWFLWLPFGRLLWLPSGMLLRQVSCEPPPRR